MSNLWSAHLLRLRRSRTFWISMGIMAASGALEALLGYGAMVELLRSGVEDAFVSLDSRYVLFHFIAGLLLSVFCALFTGAEYSDGAMRRKLAAGHSRAVVYLSHLALSVMVGVLLCLGYIAAVLAVGLPLLGPLQIPASTILFFTLCAFVMTAALAALFTLISMLCQNKAVTAVASIFLAYFLLFLGIFFNSQSTPDRARVLSGPPVRGGRSDRDRGSPPQSLLCPGAETGALSVFLRSAGLSDRAACGGPGAWTVRTADSVLPGGWSRQHRRGGGPVPEEGFELR